MEGDVDVAQVGGATDEDVDIGNDVPQALRDGEPLQRLRVDESREDVEDPVHAIEASEDYGLDLRQAIVRADLDRVCSRGGEAVGACKRAEDDEAVKVELIDGVEEREEAREEGRVYTDAERGGKRDAA